MDTLPKDTMLPLAPPIPRHTPYLRLLLLALLIGLVAAGWLFIQQPAETETASLSLEQRIQASTPTHPAPAPVMPVARPMSSTLSASSQPKSSLEQPSRNARPTPPEAKNTLKRPPSANNIQSAAAPMPVPGNINPLAANNKKSIPKRSELPVDVQQSLPDIHIEGHIYDPSPASRMVVINGHMRREGQSLASGIRLEQITEHGIILNRQGMRFRITVFGQ